jgi:hypothetical protein
MHFSTRNNLVFQTITSDKAINETILFLENGFVWAEETSSLLKEKLDKVNVDLGFHGVIMKSDDKIVGGILFFHQGYHVAHNAKRPIVNLSSWYVDKKYRGLSTISLVRFIVDTLSHCIITNYSANEAASKILLSSGFKKMELKRASIYLHQAILNFSKIKIKETPISLVKFDENFLIELQEGNKISYLCTEINSKKIDLIVKEKVLKRSLFGVKFNMRTLLVIWSSDDLTILKNWKEASYKLLKYKKCIKLIYDFKSNMFPAKQTESKNNYLIYPNNDDLQIMMPVQSEMSVFE